ncbi:MAG: GntR family transcriptional regulator [Acidimicrobiales bacterium]
MTAVPLDRNSPMPLWAQLESDLRQRLAGGEFDEQFPTDAQLCDEYDISRHTAREAVRHLNKSGVLRRERGRVTVVNRAEIEQSLGALYSLYSEIEKAGMDQTSEVLTLEVTTDADAADRLGLDDDDDLVHIVRIRYADARPLALDRAWLPADIARPLLDADLTHTGLYQELERLVGYRPDSGSERIIPELPTAADRSHLGLPADGVVFRLERLGRHAGRPIETRVTLIRGDRFRLVADWTLAAETDLRLQLTESRND